MLQLGNRPYKVGQACRTACCLLCCLILLLGHVAAACVLLGKLWLWLLRGDAAEPAVPLLHKVQCCLQELP